VFCAQYLDPTDERLVATLNAEVVSPQTGSNLARDLDDTPVSSSAAQGRLTFIRVESKSPELA
jgi:hypothetical protein